MTPGQFLRLIWPSRGFYCIAHPFRPKGSDQTVYAHRVFATISEAVTHVHEQMHVADTYFGVLSLREERVWDATKIDPRTGEHGAYRVRTQANSLASKCLFFDLDVGAAPGKYPTQADALAALTRFIAETLLPEPTLVSSGGGIHVYWHFDADVPVESWREVAWHMRQLAEHLGLKVDPTRTIDSSSVLRVLGTFNWKDRSSPREVKLLQQGVVTPVPTLLQLISDAMVRTGVTATSAPAKTSAPPALPDGLEAQTFNDFGEPPTLDEVGDACAQVREILRSQLKRDHPHYGQLDNTAWYRGMLGTLRHVENGEALCRQLTALNPRTNADIEAKLKQLAPIPPTRCASIRQIMPWGAAPCQGCLFFRSGEQEPGVPSPIVAARRTAVAPPPVVSTSPSPTPPPLPTGAAGTPPPPLPIALAPPQAPSPAVLAAMIPNPPKPYERLKSGGIALNRKDKDGNDQQVIIYRNDLYPVKRLRNKDAGTEQQVWRVKLPRVGEQEFTIDADALYDMRKFVSACANHGLYPNKGDLNALQDFMVAYITQLQRDLDAETQTASLGWADDFQQFVLPDKVLLVDGTVRPAALTEGARVATQHISKRGDLATQVQLMRFYEHPDYIANQFGVLSAYGSLILHMTGHHGMVVNMSGESGASKSTTLYAAASAWGHPKLWPINGTNRGATANARAQRMMTNGNLPTCVDEITHMLPKDAIDLAMSVSQPGHRLRLSTDGNERAVSGGTKSSIMLATANSSLHALISTDSAAGTAGSMRVFEMRFATPHVHTKAEADEFLRQLEQNYGHIGEVFAQFVVRHRAAVERRVQAVMREIDEEGGIVASERYWSAAIAANLVAGEILAALKLISYDVVALRSWALTRQIPYMRGVVKEEYRDPLAILTDYIAEKHANIVVVEKATAIGTNTGGTPTVGLKDFAANHVSGALLGHYDMAAGVLYLLKQGFKDHCARAGGSATRVLDDLHQPRLMVDQTHRRIVTNKNLRRTLGAGTTLAKGQTWCFAIDMTHPDIAGAAPVLAASGGAQTSAPAGKLSVVQ